MAMLLSFIQVLSQSPELWEPTQGLRCCRVYSLALALGLSLGLAAGSRIQPASLGLPQNQVQGIYGTLSEDPRSFHDNRGMGYLTLKQVSASGGIRASARGRVRVFFPEGTIPRVRSFGRGSGVYLEGAFLTQDSPIPPPLTGESCFRAYAVHLLRPASALEQMRTRWRMGLMERFARAPWAGLAEALLLGVQDNLDTELSKAYRDAGCSHVLALSGMHLAILTGLLSRFLRKLLGSKAASLGGGLCILGYVSLVGNFPSLERAAIMYLLGIPAVLGSVPKVQGAGFSISFLGMAFLIQILRTPEAGQSISFILSYLALGGMLFIGRAIHELIRGSIPELLAEPLAASLGAFIATAAAVAWFFDSLRPVGILAGLIIVPLSTWFMLFALFALLLPAPALGLILSILYTLLQGLVSLAARVPGIPGAYPLQAALLSLGVSAALMALSHRQTILRSHLDPFT
jgi:competence protein ComEC